MAARESRWVNRWSPRPARARRPGTGWAWCRQECECVPIDWTSCGSRAGWWTRTEAKGEGERAHAFPPKCKFELALHSTPARPLLTALCCLLARSTGLWTVTGRLTGTAAVPPLPSPPSFPLAGRVVSRATPRFPPPPPASLPPNPPHPSGKILYCYNVRRSDPWRVSSSATSACPPP